MNAEELQDLLALASGEVFVEIDGVVHPIHGFQDDSQGFYIVVDTDQEERSMR